MSRPVARVNRANCGDGIPNLLRRRKGSGVQASRGALRVLNYCPRVQWVEGNNSPSASWVFQKIS
jgi:hypothetical protein